MPTAYWRQGRVEHAPAWVMTEPFDIDARLDESEAKQFATQTAEEQAKGIRLRLQDLLRERFGLRVHAGQSAAYVWELRATRHVRLFPTAGGAAAGGDADGIAIGDGATMKPAAGPDGRHEMRFRQASMAMFALAVSGLGDEDDPPVVDGTGLPGRFDFVLTKREQEAVPQGGSAPPVATRWDVEALGLRLARGREVLPTVAVDQVHRPTAN